MMGDPTNLEAPKAARPLSRLLSPHSGRRKAAGCASSKPPWAPANVFSEPSKLLPSLDLGVDALLDHRNG